MFGKRLAQKIFLGYFVPLAVTLIAVLVIPALISRLLGQATRDYDGAVRLAENMYDLRRATTDSEYNLRGYLLYRDDSFRQQFQEKRDLYRMRYREIADYVEQQPDKRIASPLTLASESYRDWLREKAVPAIREAEEQERRGRRPSPADAAQTARESEESFAQARRRMDALVASAGSYRESQLLRARRDETLRRIVTVVIPVAGLLAVLLVNRSIALGITKPITDLTQATETVEKNGVGAAVSLLNGGDADEIGGDEVAELRRAFYRMARTIGQREAVLKAQNDALGAIGRRVEAVLNATNDGIVMLDRSGGFSVVNERFAYLFGLEPETLLDQTFAQAGPLIVGRFRKKSLVRERLRAIMEDPEIIADETFEIAEPVARTLRIYSAPVRGEKKNENDAPELLGRIFVFRDVTRETVVDRMKTEFVSTVSHELRTPLTAIKGYIDLMVGGQTGPLTDIQREFLTMAQSSTGRLTLLINDMLDISRIESGRMEVRQETVEYAPLVMEAVQMMAGEADKKGLSLRFVGDTSAAGDAKTGGGPLIIGDADRINQALVNLLSNAIKYTPRGGTVTVSVEADDGFVTTCIADTGIGLSQADMTKLFQKFFRADNSTTRSVGGTGLGLAITKAILEKMNGSIWADSAPGEGTRFYFTLPAATDAERVTGGVYPLEEDGDEAITQPNEEGIAPASASGDAAVVAETMTLVLNVDDDVSVLHLLGQQFRKRGFVASGATTQRDALRRARDLRPDLITLNPCLTASDGASGLSLLRALRADPLTQNVPVLLVAVERGALRTEAFAPLHVFTRPLSTVDLNAIRAALQTAPNAEVHVLVVGGEDVRQAIRDRFEADENIGIVCAENNEEARRLALQYRPQLAVVEVGNAESDAEVVRLIVDLQRASGTNNTAVALVADANAFSSQIAPVTPPGGRPIGIEQAPTTAQALIDARRAAASAK